MVAVKRSILILAVQLLISCMAIHAWAQSFPINGNKIVKPVSVEGILKKFNGADAGVNDEQKTLKVLRYQNQRWEEVKGMQLRNYLQGGQDLGGGNSFEAEFKVLGQIVLQNLSNFNSTALGIDILKLDKAINKVKIVATKDRLILNGNERHAANSRSLWGIVLAESRWVELNIDEKKILVLHEYLRFCDVDDSGYAISSKLAALQYVTLIQPSIDNIYHRIEFSHNIWNHERGDVVPVLIDKEKDQVRVDFDPDFGIILMVVVADPFEGGKYVHYAWSDDEKLLIDEKELKAARACYARIRSHEDLRGFIVGERAQNIIDCWGPSQKH